MIFCLINWKILFVHNWTWLKLFWGPSHWDKSKYLKRFLVFLAFIAATVFCFSSGQKVGLWLQVLGPWQAARPGGGSWRHQSDWRQRRGGAIPRVRIDIQCQEGADWSSSRPGSASRSRSLFPPGLCGTWSSRHCAPSPRVSRIPRGQDPAPALPLRPPRSLSGHPRAKVWFLQRPEFWKWVRRSQPPISWIVLTSGVTMTETPKPSYLSIGLWTIVCTAQWSIQNCEIGEVLTKMLNMPFLMQCKTEILRLLCILLFKIVWIQLKWQTDQI